MKYVLAFLIFTYLFSSSLMAQEAIIQQEVELQSLLDSLRAAKNDDAKNKWNLQFKKQLTVSLNEPTAFTFPFSNLLTIGKITSPDNKIRIFSWNVEQDDQTQKYYGFVVKNDDKNGVHTVIELIDNSFMLPMKTDEVLDADNWYGALYYEIIPVEKSNKTYYTLLGWDGNSTMSNIKLIDVLYFSGNTVKLGTPIFKTADGLKRRVYMEHSEKTVMSLRWDGIHKRIIFDHLSPESPTMEGFYEFYVPDMSYDAYVFQNNKWVLMEDVIGVNVDTESITVKSINPRTQEIEETELVNKWIDPTSSGSPAGKEIHIAVTPDNVEELDAEKTSKTKNTGEPKTALEIYNEKKHKKEKDASQTFANGGKKHKKKKKN